MNKLSKHIAYTFIVAAVVGSLFSCKDRKNTSLVDMRANEDSLMLMKANHIADSIARLTMKPDTTYRLDTAKILSNPDYAFVHNCIQSNCKQMQVIHYGIVNGFEKKIKLSSKSMMPDYEKLNAQLKEYATRNNIPLSNDTTVDLSFANSMDGQTWDSTWIDLVIKDQTAMMTDLQNAKNTVKDAQLQEMINNHMPAVSKHIEVASNLKRTY